VCNPHDEAVITVGEAFRLKLGSLDFVGDCREYGAEPPGFTWEAKVAAPMSWQAPSPSIQVQPDGTLRGLAPGSFSAVARRGNVTFETTGVVLPVGWTTKLEPEDASMSVGDSQAFRVVVSDAHGRVLPGVKFAVFPKVSPEILRGPGLVASTDKVVFRAVAEGTTSLSGYVGRQVATTRVVVRRRGDSGTRAP
jgi:hypothetical protein